MKIIGIITHIVYSGEGWTVAKLTEDHSNSEKTIVGTMNVVPGEHIEVTGRLKKHNQYGVQIQVDSYKRKVPTTEQGVETLLGSGLIKGIGPKRAKWMVNHFGTMVLDKIKTRDPSLREVPGLGPKLIESIYQQYHQFYGKERLISFLASSGFTKSMTRKIINYFDDDTLSKIEDNPYELMLIPGVGFRRADYFAHLLDISDTVPSRIEEAIIYLLEEQSSGNTYLPTDILFKEFETNIKFNATVDKWTLFETALKSLTINKRVLADDKGVHLTKFDYAESAVAKDLVQRTLLPASDISIEVVNTILNDWEQAAKHALSLEQRTAVIRSIIDNTTILTGSPGTGKTSTIAALVYLCETLDYKVHLAAPTGRAAKRMQEATGRKASTIHRLFEFGASGNFGFNYDKDSKFETDVLILDEVSMIDIMLMQSILNALKKTTKLILVGDKDQLQSIAAGNVLDDMIKSGKINTIELRVQFRQAKDSLLVKNAQLINAGHILNKESPLTSGTKWGEDDFYQSTKVTKETVLELIKTHIPNTYNISSENILTLTPMKKRYGDLNRESLNEELQNLINKDGSKLPILNIDFRVGDKVMQTKNNYIKDVFNGDIGCITSFQEGAEKGDGTFCVDFYGTIVEYDFREKDMLIHAWVSTVHKAQGSEADAVIVVLPPNHLTRLMLTRNLLYTAVTRAKKVCVLLSQNREIIKAIKTSGTAIRYTDLTDKISIWSIRLSKIKEFKRI
tara:strand:+ start:8765 stop:10972 length:2208 start_codon:yes stop_codon:yes gene_type:complete